MNIFSNPKKEHFKNKLKVIQKKIWDSEFLRDEYKKTREGFRMEYDRLKEMKDAFETRIKQENEKEDKDKTIIEQMEKAIERYNPDMEQLKKQMEQMDLLIEGPAPVEQQNRPINEILGNMRGVIETLKAIIKKL